MSSSKFPFGLSNEESLPHTADTTNNTVGTPLKGDAVEFEENTDDTTTDFDEDTEQEDDSDYEKGKEIN